MAAATARPGRWPLRVRITVLASLVITAAVVGGVLFMYLLQMNSVRRTIDSELRAYAAEVAQSAPAGTWPQPLAPSTLDTDAQSQVLAADGSVLAATRLLTGLPAIYSLAPGATEPVRQQAADGVVPGEIRVLAVRTTVAGRPVVIVTGTSTGLLSEVKSEFVRHLIYGLPGILLFASGAVWLIMGRALRPVERIRHAVTEITAADLSRRVPEPATADEIGQLARTMNDMLSRLDDAAQAQRRFVADASHELRSPLAAIRTTLEVGLAHPDRAPWPAIAGRAAEQSGRLEDLIQQLLLLARADERSMSRQRTIVDVDGLLREIPTGSSGPDLELRSAPGMRTTGDPEQLTRAFRNILDNARRYAVSSVVVSAAEAGGSVRVDIDDDGPGIPAEDRDRVFDRFVRLDRSRQRGSGTAGLGLAIAREIITAHGGTVIATASTSGGARLTIKLPTAQAVARLADRPS